MSGSPKTSKPNIRRRGNTYTWFAYITGGNGKRRQISRGGFRTIAEAEADRIKHLTDLGHGNYVNPDRITVAEYLTNEWLPTRLTDLEASTWRSYEQKIRLHVIPYIGAISLQQLTPTDLNKLYTQLLDIEKLPQATSRRHPPATLARILELANQGTSSAHIVEILQAEGHTSAEGITRHSIAGAIRRQRQATRETPHARGQLSARTVGMVHGIISKALADALRWNRVNRNVAKAATVPKPGQINQLARHTWTPDHLQRFFTFLGDSLNRYAWAFCATSGARRGEVLGLRWSDIDLERCTAAMFNQLTTDHDHQIIFKNRHKGGRGHVLHLDPPTIDLLTEWRQIQNNEKAMFGPAYHNLDYVFCLEDGRCYHPERFSREFLRKQHQYNQANPETPLPRLTIHGLRHTWATIALANNVHLKVVSDRLNHSTTHITAEVYSHVTQPIAQDAADLVGGLILGPALDSLSSITPVPESACNGETGPASPTLVSRWPKPSRS